jgi:hypothetical protein
VGLIFVAGTFKLPPAGLKALGAAWISAGKARKSGIQKFSRFAECLQGRELPGGGVVAIEFCALISLARVGTFNVFTEKIRLLCLSRLRAVKFIYIEKR